MAAISPHVGSAGKLFAGDIDMKRASLVRLRQGTEDAPIFLFSGTHANSNELATLASCARNPKAMIGVDYCERNDDGGFPMTVAAMADRSFSAIRALQRRGPYYMVGYSFGGLVAIETARLLRESGEEIALLGLIDTFFDRRYWPTGILLRSHLVRLLRMPPSTAIPIFFSLARRIVIRFLKRQSRLASTIATPKAGHRSAAEEHCLTAMANYRPRYYPGTITLFLAENHDHGCNLAKLWRNMASEVESWPVLGTHLGLVNDGTSSTNLGIALDRCLDDLNSAANEPRSSSYAPKVLLITARRWPTTTRLALALSEAGFMVEALCPTGHSLAQVKFVNKAYGYFPLSPLRSLRDAIAASQPDLIIPSDDIVAGQLHKLYELTNAKDSVSRKLRSLIARSLGAPENYSILYSRAQIASVAQSAGVLSPTVTDIRNHDELACQLERIGFPAVLKIDGSSGGMGVAIVRDQAEARRNFGKLAAYHNVARALKRLIVDSDANLILPYLRRAPAQISIQRFIYGRPANAAVACWNGEVLAQVCVEVLASNGATGPATVVRVIAHPGMSQAVERMVRALKLSGLCGFDFILDSSDEGAYLVDLNPRATQTCHLVSYEGTQPVASLAAKLRGLPIVDDLRGSHCKPIVLFPHGLVCDPKSPYSQYAQSDLPAKFPEFVKFGLGFHQAKNRFLAKFIRFTREKWH
jgi:thioesterase domain-containing protein/carbamoylphosphate synthase large subunit